LLVADSRGTGEILRFQYVSPLSETFRCASYKKPVKYSRPAQLVHCYGNSSYMLWLSRTIWGKLS